MLVCPQCQFENPDTHRFCQKCGESLTEQVCPSCETTVALNAEYCLQCGNAVGTFWKALLIPAQDGSLQPIGRSILPENSVSAPTGRAVPTHLIRRALSNGKYLDVQQRYCICTLLPDQIDGAEAEVRVLDCRPLQSPLRDYEHWHPSRSLPEISPALLSLSVTVPPIAEPYLELEERYPALPLPRLHDAWEQDGLQILLLEDRSTLPPLLDFWRDEQVLPIQLLHWLHEMIGLWTALQSEHCCQSLLVLDNLRIDEDSLLCLQRLYADRPEQPPQLRDLGRLWQSLFQRSQRTQRGDLAQLYSDLELGVVASLDQLRSRIEEIATALQANFSLVTVPSSPSEPLNPFMIDDATLNGDALFGGSLSNAATQDSAIPPITPPLESISAADGSGSLGVELPALEDDFEDELPTLPNEDAPETDDPTIVLPMRLASLDDAGLTDIGRQRDHNEDCFSIQTEVKKADSSKGRSLQAKGLYILCDGMGGHASGEVASALAVETLQKYFAEHWQDKLPSHESIREAIHQANQAIYDLNQQNSRSGSGRMGTTLVLVLVQDTEAAIAHVGDSRLYRFSRRQGLEAVTVDHEVGQREIQRGVEPAIAYARPDAYQLTQALGPRDENFVSPDIRFLELNEDMLLLLCSDGLTDNNLLETHWQSHVEPLLSSQNNLEQGVHQLIELANQQNGHDNITAIAIRAKVRPDLHQFGH